MKIAFVCQPWDRVLPSQGSVTTSIGILALEIASRVESDDEVTIYSAADKRELRLIVEKDKGRNYRALPGASLENRLSLPFKLAYERLARRGNPFRPFFATKYYYWFYGRQLANDIRQQGFDIVHIFNFYQFIPAIRARNPNVKIVLHMECNWLGQLDHDLLHPILEQTDLVIGCSTFITESGARRFPDLANRFVTVNNGVNMEQFRREENGAMPAHTAIGKPKKLIFVGRLSPEKGVHLAIEAFIKVRQKLSNVQLDIIGPAGSAPPEFLVLLEPDQRVKDLIRFYGEDGKHDVYYDQLMGMIPPDLQSDITFHGTVAHEALLDYYRHANIYLSTSFSEAFSMPVSEAMASGTPVIAPRVGGIPDMVIHNETGLMFELGNVDELAETIIHALSDEQNTKAMSLAAAKRIETLFSWERIGSLIRNHYAALLAK